MISGSEFPGRNDMTKNKTIFRAFGIDRAESRACWASVRGEALIPQKKEISNGKEEKCLFAICW